MHVVETVVAAWASPPESTLFLNVVEGQVGEQLAFLSKDVLEPELEILKS